MKTKETTNKSKNEKSTSDIEKFRAKQVVELYPSFHELMKNPMIKKLLHPMVIYAFSNSQEWEGVSMAVQQMVLNVGDRQWYNGYSISKKGNGTAWVLDHAGREYKVDGITFWALTKIMFCSWLRVELSDEAIKASENFKYNNKNIYSILN